MNIYNTSDYLIAPYIARKGVLRVDRNNVLTFITIIFACIISYLIVRLLGVGQKYTVIEFCWLAIITYLIAVQMSKIHASPNIKNVVWAGYIARGIFAFMQSYFREYLPSFIANDDQPNFVNVAFAYQMGDYSKYSTNFPYILNFLYRLFGNGDFAIRVIFVYLWFLGFVLLYKVAGELKGGRSEKLIIFYTFLPWTLYVSTALLREPIKEFSLMLSIYFLWKWMNSGDMKEIIWSVLATVPALWLHNGEVAVVGVIFITYIFWDPKAQKWIKYKFTWKIGMLVLAIVLFPQIYRAFTFLFPGKFTGSFSITSLLGSVVYTDARTNYVTDVTITSPLQFAFWTIYRMFYFWVSPTPRFWNLPADILMFAIDTIPWLWFFYRLIKDYKRGILGNKSRIWILIFVMFTFIFAWGTRNAGTAMRHRDHFAGMLVMTALMMEESKSGNNRKIKASAYTTTVQNG